MKCETNQIHETIGGIILVVGAVFFQAFAELMLPNLMSQIVDQESPRETSPSYGR